MYHLQFYRNSIITNRGGKVYIRSRDSNVTSHRVQKIKALVLKRIKILEWMPKYSREDVLADFIAGLTVGLTMMPQSIAYAALAGLQAQYGLYTAFIGSFTYVLFGTIKQVSIGPTSLMSILTYTYVMGYSIDYVILLTFIAGCIELLMGVFNLGFLLDFISPPVVSGFTSATSVIIVSTQLKGLFGVPLKSHGFFTCVTELFSRITEVKLADTLLGLSCIIVLYGFKQLTKITTRSDAVNKLLWFLSISKNAIVVLVGSIIGFCFIHYTGESPFKLSGNVPSGMPNFTLPNFSTTFGNETVSFFEMVHTLGSGIIVVPIVAVLANIAIAKSFTVGIIVDTSQEMITLGLCNIFGSFVQAMPSCGAFTRSAVANSSGVRTPLQGIYSGTIIILALSFLTPYFYYIPTPTLSAVLISAVVQLIDYEIVPKLWKTNKFDLAMTALTFFVGICYSSDAGIVVGSFLNLIILLKPWSRPNIITYISKDDNGEEYLYIRPEFGLCYPGTDYLTQTIIKVHNTSKYLPITIDCSNLTTIDFAGAEALGNIVQTYNRKSIVLTLMNVTPTVFESLQKFVDVDNLHLCQCAENKCEVKFKKIPLEEFNQNESEEQAVLLNKLNEQINNYPNLQNERKQSIYDNL